MFNGKDLKFKFDIELFVFQNFKQRMEHKAMLARVKEMEKALKDDVIRQREELKARQEANKKKREENARKSEIIQVVRS